MRSYYTWRHIAREFCCGRNKAMKILHMQPGRIYVGRTPMVSKENFERWLEECDGEIRVEW